MKLTTINENDTLLKKVQQKKQKYSNVYFIGDWCADSQNYFSNSKILDVYKYCYSSKKKKNDVRYLKKTYETILTNLTTSLNQYHKKKYTKKYWEILLFRWLWLYLLHLYSVWEIARLTIKKYPIKLIYSLDLNKNYFIPENTIHHKNIILSQNNYWINLAFKEIFRFNYRIKIENIGVIRNLKRIVSNLNPGIFKPKIFFQKSEKLFFFYNFNIPFKEKLIIFVKTLKYSFFAKILFLNKIKINNDKKLRKKFYLYKKSKDSFFNFANIFLKFNFPKIYLENYKFLENEYQKVNWPQKPRYILTSHAHYFDEIFKIYAAKKTLDKSKLYILQHGSGGFFINDNFYNIYLEKKISDKYFAWGDEIKDKNVISFPITTVLNNKENKKFKFIKKNKLLVELYDFNETPTRPPLGYVSSRDRKIITLDLFKNFFENLEGCLKSKINLKILNNSSKQIIENEIKKNYSNINILNTKKFSYQIAQKFNIQIHFYIGTGFFESMYLNNPVILIFDEKLCDGVNKKFIKIINLLIESNICFKNSIDAANFINLNYQSIDTWWNKTRIQKIRGMFAKKYCGSNISLSKKLIKILNSK